MSNPNVTVDRQKYIGGSDLPNILGLNLKYGTTVFEWAKIKAGIIPNNFKGNIYTKYGQLMEPVIRDYINATQETNFVEDTCVSEILGLRGNCDGIDRDNALLLEIKTHGAELDDEYYSNQMQFYMELFNIDTCWLVGYERPENFYTGTDYEIEYDDCFFDTTFDESRVSIQPIERNKKKWDKIMDSILRFKKCVTALKKNPNMTEDQFNKLFYGADLVTTLNKVAKMEKSLLKFKELDKQYKEAKEKLYDLFDERNIKTFDTGTMKITKVDPSSSTSIVYNMEKLQEENPKIDLKKYQSTKTTNKKGYILITAKKEAK